MMVKTLELKQTTPAPCDKCPIWKDCRYCQHNK